MAKLKGVKALVVLTTLALILHPSDQFSIGGLISSGIGNLTFGLAGGVGTLGSGLASGAGVLSSGLVEGTGVLASTLSQGTAGLGPVGQLVSTVGEGTRRIGSGAGLLVSTVGGGAEVSGEGTQVVVSKLGEGTQVLASKVGEGILGLTEQARDIVSTLGAPAHLSWNPNDVHFFWYYNPKDPSERKELIFNDWTSLEEFPANRPLIVISHGFREDTLHDASSTQIKDAYLKAGYASTSNIVLVDWGRMSGISPIKILLADNLALLPVYIGAVSDVYVVAHRVADFLAFLINNQLVTGGKDIHLVGHSLGAQVSGMTGYHFKNIVPGDSISRITGCDPAGPLFQFIPMDFRLDPTDADFVDVIHTNQGVFGYILQTGQVDFFLNGGGPLQPFCAKWSDPVGCSHGLAPQFFAESILNKTMTATCRNPGTCEPEDIVTFGEFALPGTKGSFEVDASL